MRRYATLGIMAAAAITAACGNNVNDEALDYINDDGVTMDEDQYREAAELVCQDGEPASADVLTFIHENEYDIGDMATITLGIGMYDCPDALDSDEPESTGPSAGNDGLGGTGPANTSNTPLYTRLGEAATIGEALDPEFQLRINEIETTDTCEKRNGETETIDDPGKTYLTIHYEAEAADNMERTTTNGIPEWTIVDADGYTNDTENAYCNYEGPSLANIKPGEKIKGTEAIIADADAERLELRPNNINKPEVTGWYWAING